MCGVVGYAPTGDNEHGRTEYDVCRMMFGRLMTESKIRGLHSFGLATFDRLIRAHTLQNIIDEFDPHETTIAHCRYSTSGDWKNLDNCQPIRVGERVLAFNGVIHMGKKDEFEYAFDVKCESDNDGEVFLRLLDKNVDAIEFITNMRGSFAGVWIDAQGDLHALRNERRPLWRCDQHGATWFASTKDIFQRAGFNSLIARLYPGHETVI